MSVRLGRLQEAASQVFVAREGEVGRFTDEDRPWARQVEPLRQLTETVLVDELLDRRMWCEARREALADVRRQAGHGERPLVAARDEDGPGDLERAQIARQRIGVVAFDQGPLRPAIPARPADDVGRVVHDPGLDPSPSKQAQHAERGDVGTHDQDRDLVRRGVA